MLNGVSRISSVTPSFRPEVQILRNLNTIALPAILAAAAMGIPKADAGPITYGICVAGCIAINPTWGALCPVLCLPAVSAPGP